MTRTIRTALQMSPVPAGAAQAQVTLTIESRRTDDLAIWQDRTIPAFAAQNPGITVAFAPSAPAEANAAPNSKPAAGSAGDLIACRPCDASLELHNQGHPTDLGDLPAMANVSPVAKSARQTDDGSATACVPMASVIHGFIWHADAVAEVGVEVPATEAQFFAVLAKIKAHGGSIPMAMGTNDPWEAATTGGQNIGPNSWKGEQDRRAPIRGEQKLTDEPWVAPFRALAKWQDYRGEGFEAQTYPDSQNLFTLGRAAIYPAGSWEIAGFTARTGFRMGAFPPPVQAAGDTCSIADHTDIAIGLNAKSPSAVAARTFLKRVGSPEFAALYANALPGFFSLSATPVAMRDPLAQEFVSWRGKCRSTIRATCQILPRGTPNLENETWNASAKVIRATGTPEAVAERLQAGLASWYGPQK